MNKLAIVGASYLQLPLVLKAKEMGIQTHCFAWEDGAVCKTEADFFYPVSVHEKEQILKICSDQKINGITTIATDMAVPTVSHVAQHLGLFGNSVESAQNSTDKAKMRESFAIGNVNIPRFTSTDVFIENLNIRFPVIVKPVDRSGSRGVSKVDSAGELRDAVSIAITESFAKRAIIEEFIEGHEVSVETISWQGKHHFLAITDKVTTGAPHFVELAHHQPSQLPEIIVEKLKQQTFRALDAVGMQFGAAHTELKVTSTGDVYVIETGTRMGGDFIGSHLVQLSTGYDFLKGVIDVAFGNFEIPQKTVSMHAGVYFLCKETEKLLPYFENKTTFEIEKTIQNSCLKTITNSNDRSGYFIYQSAHRINLL